MDQTFLEDKIIGFLGGGNMAQAIGFGLMNKKCLKPENILVSSRTRKTLSVWETLNVRTTTVNQDIFDNSDIIFIAVKPQNLDNAIEDCTVSKKGKNQIIISVLVGVTLKTLTQKFSKFKTNKIIRSMPNTPMLLSEGITVFCCSEEISPAEKDAVNYMFSMLGVCEEIAESLMNSAGGLCGSGPAYAYMMIEALSDGAVKVGIPRALAIKMAAQVLIGAGRMVLETGKHPGQLKDEVTSPGGSTIAGVHAIESGAVRASLINAVGAAASRSNELTALHK